jgi:hypothetical protein
MEMTDGRSMEDDRLDLKSSTGSYRKSNKTTGEMA